MMKASRAGAEIHQQERVKKITLEADHYRVEASRAVYRSLYLIGADGVNGISARYLG